MQYGRKVDLKFILHMEDFSQQSAAKSAIWLGFLLSNFKHN